MICFRYDSFNDIETSSLYMGRSQSSQKVSSLRSEGVSGFRSRGGVEELHSRSKGGDRCGEMEAASRRSSGRIETPDGFHLEASYCKERLESFLLS